MICVEIKDVQVVTGSVSEMRVYLLEISSFVCFLFMCYIPVLQYLLYFFLFRIPRHYNMFLDLLYSLGWCVLFVKFVSLVGRVLG